MILEHSFSGSNTSYEHIELEASPKYLGSPEELVSMATDALTETHNLSIALARFEHKCITESAGAELMNEGVKEWFSKAAEAIKRWWGQFMAWLGSLWTRLKDIFIKREDWLKRHRSAIEAKTDADLKNMKVKIGVNAAKTGINFTSTIEKTIKKAEEVVNEAAVSKIEEPAEIDGLIARLRTSLANVLHPGVADDNGVEKKFHDTIIGSTEVEMPLSPAFVKKCIERALDTFSALDKLKGAKAVADAAISRAAGMAVVKGGEEKVVQGRIRTINAVSPKIQSGFSAMGSVLAAANGQYMAVCIKAAGAKAAADSTTVQNNSGDLLAAFM